MTEEREFRLHTIVPLTHIDKRHDNYITLDHFHYTNVRNHIFHV